MMEAIKGIISSKKFWLTVAGSAVVAALNYAGAPHDITLMVGSLFGVNVAAQGIADHGTNSAK